MTSLEGIQHWPKIELHLHLDCCLSFEAACLLEPGLTFQRYRTEFVVPARVGSLEEFLRRTRRSLDLLQSEEGLRVAIFDVMRQLQRDGVVYAELRFAPLQHLEGGLTPEQVVHVVAQSTKHAVSETGVEAGVLLCALRHHDAAQSLQTAELVQAFRGTRVVGFDLAGDEAGFPLAPHVPAFEYAARQGLPCTAHAGEVQGAESVRETLDRLRPSRIGHGVRSIEDPALLTTLKRANIHLEICPTCNVQIGLYPALAAHPVDRLYRQGLSVGVNTDTRTLSDTTLSAEYRHLIDQFGWTPGDFWRCNLAALDASFAAQPTKDRLREALSTSYQT